MEQVQQKRGLRIVAAIMFLLICALQIAGNVWNYMKEDYLFHGDGAARMIISRVAVDLIYNIAIYAVIAIGLLAKRKSNGLRFTAGAVFAALLITRIVILLTGGVPFLSILRRNWDEFLMLAAAAVCLFAVKHISVPGVGFSMLAWDQIVGLMRSENKSYGTEWADLLVAVMMIVIFVLVAVVCFLNDSEKVRGAAKPLGIVAIVFAGIWYLSQQIIIAIDVDTMIRYESGLVWMMRAVFFGLFLFLGVLFAMIAIAFRKKSKAAAKPQYQQPSQQYWQPQPQYQPVQPQYQQPAYQQPQYAPVQQPAYQQPQPEAEWICALCGAQNPASGAFCQNCGTKKNAAEQQEEAQQTRGSVGGDFRDLNWEQYAPLEAGVSMKPDKDYKFHRADGFVGSLPQKFVDRTFVKCPICCSANPHWTISQHNQMSWKGNLYLFKCSDCDSVISMSMPDVTTLGNGGVGVAANPSVGLTNLMVKASSGKEAGAVYAVIESVGRSGVNPACQGKEFKLEQLQQMSLRV